MNIYKIWVDGYIGYDAYDSAIVVAKDEEKARYIHPGTTSEDPVKGIILRLIVMIRRGMRVMSPAWIGQNQGM